ncbi:MAG: hypothetical protein GF334_13080 [Candidatus Altiarchaeales archaeon]|nr:hypothetical protein [Candidatus Altiarchaeales archaeon]
MKVVDLKDKTPVEEIILVVKEVREPTQTRVGMVQQVDAEDDSGSCTITLWNDQTGSLAAGDKVKITNGWCKEYQSQLQVSSGKFGSIEKIEE